MRILFGTDGSRAACEALLQVLETLALARGAATLDVMAVEPSDFGSGIGADGIAQANIAAAIEHITARHLSANGIVAFGDPATELIARAEATAPDLVVLGADRTGVVGDHPLAASIGHVAATVALDGHASAFVATGDAPIRRVIVACDGSADAESAVEMLSTLPFRVAPEIVVVAVAEPPTGSAGVQADVDGSGAGSARETVEVAQAIAAEAADRLRPIASRVHVRTPVGRPTEQLLVVAREVGADLIVVGSRGLGAQQRRRMGSVTASLLQRMPTSLLIARAAPEPT